MPADATETPEASAATIDAAEVAKFAALAAEWWDPKGKLAPLHALNPVRLAFIRDEAKKVLALPSSGGAAGRLRGESPGSPEEQPHSASGGRPPHPAGSSPRRGGSRDPLAGLTLLDVGCGGGLVCEPLARLGARVTGIDAAEAGIGAARAHAAQSGLAIDYRVSTAEALLASGAGPYDVVTALEIVEHVADPALFLATCARLVRPGGVLIVSTLNRTPRAFALAIAGAEWVLGWLPRGTHDWSKFLKPEEVAAPLRAEGLDVGEPVGVAWSPLDGRWRLSHDASVNYMLAARGT